MSFEHFWILSIYLFFILICIQFWMKSFASVCLRTFVWTWQCSFGFESQCPTRMSAIKNDNNTSGMQQLFSSWIKTTILGSFLGSSWPAKSPRPFANPVRLVFDFQSLKSRVDFRKCEGWVRIYNDFRLTVHSFNFHLAMVSSWKLYTPTRNLFTTSRNIYKQA